MGELGRKKGEERREKREERREIFFRVWCAGA
jgi:hypothetical protein